MNRFISGLGLLLLIASAWAQPPVRAANGSCISNWEDPWIQVDDQTAIVNAGKKAYLVTVPACSSFFAGLNSEVVGSNGSRLCEGDEIRYSDGNHQYVESCFIQDIVRYQVNPRTNAVEINEFDD